MVLVMIAAFTISGVQFYYLCSQIIKKIKGFRWNKYEVETSEFDDMTADDLMDNPEREEGKTSSI